MNKLKFLSISVVGLLIVNTLLIIALFIRKPHPNHEGPKQLIIEKLQFDKQQIKDYNQMVDWHRKEIGQAEDQLFQLKNELYSHLTQPLDTVVKDSLITAILKVQTNIENIHYKHFLDIKQLCKPNQQTDFEALTKEIASLFGRQRNKR